MYQLMHLPSSQLSVVRVYPAFSAAPVKIDPGWKLTICRSSGDTDLAICWIKIVPALLDAE